ncbi:MAG: hypothetical protein HZA78_05305 [Candidatus Schekmanbacteria bacterium]|nr:hypothetical protein [Candidatus Schekmanbacteria bacterium]
MQKPEKPKWQTPQIESLEISNPKICNRPFIQDEICQAQGVPIGSIPCTPSAKGSPSQTFS